MESNLDLRWGEPAPSQTVSVVNYSTDISSLSGTRITHLNSQKYTLRAQREIRFFTNAWTISELLKPTHTFVRHRLRKMWRSWKFAWSHSYLLHVFTLTTLSLFQGQLVTFSWRSDFYMIPLPAVFYSFKCLSSSQNCPVEDDSNQGRHWRCIQKQKWIKDKASSSMLAVADNAWIEDQCCVSVSLQWLENPNFREASCSQSNLPSAVTIWVCIFREWIVRLYFSRNHHLWAANPEVNI
jgi:hypothetical protein